MNRVAVRIRNLVSTCCCAHLNIQMSWPSGRKVFSVIFSLDKLCIEALSRVRFDEKKRRQNGSNWSVCGCLLVCVCVFVFANCSGQRAKQQTSELVSSSNKTDRLSFSDKPTSCIDTIGASNTLTGSAFSVCWKFYSSSEYSIERLYNDSLLAQLKCFNCIVLVPFKEFKHN